MDVSSQSACHCRGTVKERLGKMSCQLERKKVCCHEPVAVLPLFKHDSFGLPMRLDSQKMVVFAARVEVFHPRDLFPKFNESRGKMRHVVFFHTQTARATRATR